MIELKNLEIGYKGKPILEAPISISGEEYQLILLVGRNGKGKSTLLKTLSGFIQKVKGEVLFNGKALNTFTDKERSKKVIYLNSSQRVNVPLNVEDTILLGRFPFETPLTKSKFDVRPILSMLEIDHLISRTIDTLSDGEYQKVMLAKALAQEPDWLLLDEPTIFLDYLAKETFLKTLRMLCDKKKVSVIFSSHDLQLSSEMSDEIWLLNRNGIDVLSNNLKVEDISNRLKDN